MVCDFFLIAGEPSGDALGASLMKGLKAKATQPFVIEGIGGPQMEAEGLKSLVPMSDLCVMGLLEVLGHLPRLLKLIEGIAEEIEERQPKVVVTIDLPDFNFRVAQRLKKKGIFKGKIVHYVAPSVWAWRAGRAKKVAQYLDGMMCLFPFEPPYFRKENLKSAYVGHPLIEVDKTDTDRAAFRKAREIPEDALCLGLFFGSREAEIKSHAKIFVQTVEALLEQYPELYIVAPTLPQLELEIIDVTKKMNVHVYVEPNVKRKWHAFASCDVALAVSGTVALELAYMNVPHVVAYKAHPLTALIIKKMTKLKYVHLANILLNAPAVPEFLQNHCNPFELTKGVMKLIKYEEERKKQLAAFESLDKMLAPEGDVMPSEASANFVLEFYNQN